jgi:hypothetical protein
MSVGLNRDRSPLKPSPDDWLFSDLELDEAEKTLEEEVDLDTEHDIPYAAGYSKDGMTCYIDKEVPEFLEVISSESKTKTVKISLWKSFGFHELVEKSLEAEPYYLHYQLAHQIALRAERAYVESKGGDWNDYNTKTLELVDKIYKRDSFDNVPADLDLEPYEDEEDEATLKKMKKDK